jgi:DNA-directed RNA polymerase subunit RPC12/RpoP
VETTITLYQCDSCGRILDEADTEKVVPCPCGSRMVRLAVPSALNVARYFLRHPKMLLLWGKEALWRSKK